MNEKINQFRFIENHETKSDQSFSLILVSFLFVIFISIICLSSVTWSWFTASQTATAESIKTASFSVLAEIRSGESLYDSKTVTAESITFPDERVRLDVGKEYEITLTPNGTANQGYCILEINQKSYYADIPDGGLCFTYIPKSDQGQITITAYWGTISQEKLTLLEKIDQLGIYDVSQSEEIPSQEELLTDKQKPEESVSFEPVHPGESTDPDDDSMTDDSVLQYG